MWCCSFLVTFHRCDSAASSWTNWTCFACFLHSQIRRPLTGVLRTVRFQSWGASSALTVIDYSCLSCAHLALTFDFWSRLQVMLIFPIGSGFRLPFDLYRYFIRGALNVWMQVVLWCSCRIRSSYFTTSASLASIPQIICQRGSGVQHWKNRRHAKLSVSGIREKETMALYCMICVSSLCSLNVSWFDPSLQQILDISNSSVMFR